jgi:hypothetical protein
MPCLARQNGWMQLESRVFGIVVVVVFIVVVL